MDKQMNCGCGHEQQPCVEVALGHGVVPPLKPVGPRAKATVSASGQVMRGEFVRRVAEYAAVGDDLRWGNGDVHVLDAAELSGGRVGVVFTQGDATKFKVLALVDGELALGNTLVVTADEAVQDAKVIELPDDRALVIYSQDAAGMAAVITLEDRAATLAYTDIWDDHDVANLCVCHLSGDTVLLAGMRQAAREHGQVWARVATVGSAYLRLDTAVHLEVDSDQDVYTGAWALCRASAQTAVLCYPRALDRPVGFAILDVDDSSARGLRIRVIGSGKYAASLPTIAAVGLDGGRWAMAYGIGWLSANRQVVKSTLALEVWGLTRYAAELLWYGCEDIRYEASIGAVGLEPNGIGLVCSYTGDDEGRSILVGMMDGPSPGPAVPLGAHNGFCRVVPISITAALLVTQREGNGYVRLMRGVERVIPSETSANGIALSGGGPGEEITVATAP